MEDWYQNPHTLSKNGPIVWKSLVASFEQIGKWATKRIEDGKKVRIKEDRLSHKLLHRMPGQWIFPLTDARAQVPQQMGLLGWKTTKYLGLKGEKKNEW